MQLKLPFDPQDETLFGDPTDLSRTGFSHDSICPQEARLALEDQYVDLLRETDDFDRRLVSYQGNKDEILHSWIKYREGFSAQLVQRLIHEFGIAPDDTILEPFSGSATTLLVAKSLGINAVGIEILPICHLAWNAKSYVFDYDLNELEELFERIRETQPRQAENAFPHLVITNSAFPTDVENDLMFYTEWFDELDISLEAKTLFRLILSSILEQVSYTRKDGQYLRWDSRSEKVIRRNQIRLEQGKKPFKGMDKGELPAVKKSILEALGVILEDIRALQTRPFNVSHQMLIRGSVLNVLPSLESDQYAGVITSPPYCNRYDYTRTYALELAYLGVGEEGIRALRQSQLSCTVENRSKLTQIEQTYKSIGQIERFQSILQVIRDNPVLQEINHALQVRWDRGEINNKGILPMVEGYFVELTFVFAEIFRACRSGAQVAFVNDNVRYGGEIIPVDLLSTNLAEQLGFEPVKVYVLPQRKGNSSQQMKRFGREPLRKSITIWKKP